MNMFAHLKSKPEMLSANDLLEIFPISRSGIYDLLREPGFPCIHLGRRIIVPRDAIPCSNSIFNSAVVPYKDGFAGVFRCDDKRREMRIHSAHSRDAIHWDIDPEPFNLVNPMAREVGPFVYGYDPRCCEIDGEYVVTWCNGYHGPTIGVATPTDLKPTTRRKTPSCPSTAMGSSFPGRSAAYT